MSSSVHLLSATYVQSLNRSPLCDGLFVFHGHASSSFCLWCHNMMHAYRDLWGWQPHMHSHTHTQHTAQTFPPTHTAQTTHTPILDSYSSSWELNVFIPSHWVSCRVIPVMWRVKEDVPSCWSTCLQTGKRLFVIRKPCTWSNVLYHKYAPSVDAVCIPNVRLCSHQHTVHCTIWIPARCPPVGRYAQWSFPNVLIRSTM